MIESVFVGNEIASAVSPKSSNGLQEVVRREWQHSLTTKDYDAAATALGEVRALRQWRKAAKGSPFADFYQLIEGVTTINKIATDPQKNTALKGTLVESLIPRVSRFSPRVRDLYMGLLSQVDGTSYKAEFPMTEAQLQQLQESGDLRFLQDPTISYEIKLNRMRTRIESELAGRKALDRRDRKKQQEQNQKNSQEDEESEENSNGEEREGESEGEKSGGEQSEEPSRLPPESLEHESTMEEVKRLKEGETASPICVISPGYGGYWRERVFDTWDTVREKWTQSAYQFETVAPVLVDSSSNKQSIEISLNPHQWTRVPLSDDFDIEAIVNNGIPVELQRDQYSDYRIRTGGDRIVLVLQKIEKGSKSRGTVTDPIQIPSRLTEVTLQEIQKISQRKSNLLKARALSAYTKRRLHYSNDPAYNAIYKNHAMGKIGGIDREREADCDVTADYFAALCSRSKIPVRLVIGHMVKGENKNGDSQIHSGTGHAWNEVWDEENKKWVRIDATPPGDPQMEEGQSDSQLDSVPGDYGEEEAIGPSEDELMKLEKELSALTEKLSYTPDERELASATAIDLKEARKIIREIQKAEATKLPNGERVADVLSQLFNLIIESRKITQPSYTGPVRLREGGGEIENIVAHKIGVISRDPDPSSRQRETDKEVESDIIGGFDVFMIGDKSGSMNETVSTETKLETQRLAEYLIFSSLHRFEQNLARARVKMIDPLSVRSEGISFRGNTPREIDLDKPLSSELTPAGKVLLWRSLSKQGMGNGDVAALQRIHTQIQNERELLKQVGKKDDRLRIVIACSDGAPDSPAGVHQMAQALGELNAVVVGVGLTETAAAVPLIFDTPYSKGDIAKDINDLPVIVARHVIGAAVRLFPERNKKLVERQINTIIRKFGIES